MILTSCHEMPYFFSTEKTLAISTASYQHSKYWQQHCCELEVKIQGDTQDKKNGNSNTHTVLNNWVVCGVAWALSDTVVLHSTKKKKKKKTDLVSQVTPHTIPDLLARTQAAERQSWTLTPGKPRTSTKAKWLTESCTTILWLYTSTPTSGLIRQLHLSPSRQILTLCKHQKH